MINLKLPLLNIPVDELLEEREADLRQFVINACGQETLDRLLATNNSLNEYLHEIGVRKGLYLPGYNNEDLPKIRMNIRDSTPSAHRYIQANGFTPEIIGRPTNRGFLSGPYVLAINNFTKPYRVMDHGIRIIVHDNPEQEFGYGFMTSVKAINIIERKDAIRNYIVYDENGCEIRDLESQIINSRTFRENEPFLFDTRIENAEYINNAGSFVFKGAGEQREWNGQRWTKKKGVQAVYTVTLKQPPMYVNGKIVIMNNSELSSTTPAQIERIDVQEEFKKKDEETKQNIAATIALDKGSNYIQSKGHSSMLIRIPKRGNPIDNINYYRLPNNTPNSTMYAPGSVIKPAILYRNTNINSKTTQYLNGLATYLKYVKGYNENVIDNIMQDNFWDLLASPEILWQMIIRQDCMRDRYINTCFKTGAAISGTLINPSKPSPYTLSDYSTMPITLDTYVQTPLPSATINVNNGYENKNATLTIWTGRMHELKPCYNTQCTEYQKYYPMDRNGAIRHTCKIEQINP